MSDFVIKPGTPSAAIETPIVGDPFLPEIDPAQLRVEQRVEQAVTAPRWRAALVGAILSVGNDLVGWQGAQLAAGYATLAEVPTPAADGTSRIVSIDGTNRLVLLYRRAVGCAAKAELIRRSPDLDTTGAGDRRGDAMEPTADDLRREAAHSVRDMLGRTRTCVELI